MRLDSALPAIGRRHYLLLILAAAPIFAGMAAIELASPAQRAPWIALAAWMACALIGTAVLKRCLPARDPLLFPLVIFLSGWGLVAIQRLAPPFAERQTLWLIISVAALLFAAATPYALRWLRVYRYVALLLALLLLLATIAFGSNPSGFANAPRLWLSLGALYFQPSEIMKILLVAFMASYLSEGSAAPRSRANETGLRLRFSPRLLGPMLLMWLLSLLILVWQRDLGAAMLFFVVFFLLMYLSSGDGRIPIGGALLVLIAALVAYHLFDVVKLRVDIWLNPWPEAAGRAYQIVQSLMAFGAGGIFGAGVGLGSAAYIPLAHSDFVFAALAEEWGLLGVVCVLSCFALIAYRGLSIGLCQSGRGFHRMLAVGLTMMIVAQALQIMGGVLKLLPLTGVTLPFISYGGSSLLVCFTMTGILLRLSANSASARLTRTYEARFARGVHWLFLGALAGLLTIGLSAAYWAITGWDSILLRDDNPRRIEALAAIRRGGIYDRRHQPLALTTIGGASPERRYLRPSTNGIVGYYSLRFGVGGAESAYEELLSGASELKTLGDFINRRVLKLPQIGSDIRLTIDADLQDALVSAMEDASGAAVVLDAQSSEVLALVSLPSYDPNTLDAEWDELIKAAGQPFFNRALQGNYQLGGAMYTLLLAQALGSSFDPDLSFPNADAPIDLEDGMTVACLAQPDASELTLVEAYRNGCPAPFQAYWLAHQRGGLDTTLAPYRFDEPFTLAGFPQAEPIEIPHAPAADELDFELRELRTLHGQGDITTTPLHLASIMAAIASDGRVASPTIWSGYRPPDAERWRSATEATTAVPILSPDVARKLRTIMREAWTIRQEGPVSAAGDVGAQIARSRSGDELQLWLTGFMTRPNDTSFAFVLLLENSDDIPRLIAIGQALIQAPMVSPR
ncbi:MAG: FtsW/RodA/SpoVE family cell cycle protein [Chloroflexi bacterium]|nr:FtsW/RodA/SpoVE family cell cycle protein [Chloroflexota bacterium]